MWLLTVVAVATFAVLGHPHTAFAQEATCFDFRTLKDNEKVNLAYGYLEGVQAALDKDVADILVPPSDERHPLWLVLPAGLGEKPILALAEKLDSHCQLAPNAKQPLLAAFLALAFKKEGWPAYGISSDKKKTDPWRNFLGGKETSVSCAAYAASPDATQKTIVHGYHLGTRALRSRLGGKDIGIVWPEHSTVEAVRIELNQRCTKDRTATVREVLWVITVEMSVKKR